ncbi:lipoprotein [Streptomyces sp. NPDC085466]|uniref:lipoprotein n=1 Tax=Streptomyces sp. NPDC085466 TaxID=3365725 RepID=UPI0037CF48FF
MPARSPFPVTVLLAAALLTACGTAPEPDVAAAPATSATATTPATESAAVSPSPSATRALGGAGTACALPVSFSLTEDWEPKKVEPLADPDFADLLKQGPATVVCEAKAEGTPHIGFLRVWTAPKGPLRPTLDAFVKADKSKGLALTDLRVGGAGGAGGVPGVEARYSVYSELTEEWRKQRAFAVTTAKGVLVVELGGLDSEEDDMVAAYERVKAGLTVS